MGDGISLFESIVGVDCGKFVAVESVKLAENVASNRFPETFDLVGVLLVCEIPLGLSPVSPFGSLVCNT